MPNRTITFERDSLIHRISVAARRRLTLLLVELPYLLAAERYGGAIAAETDQSQIALLWTQLPAQGPRRGVPRRWLPVKRQLDSIRRAALRRRS